MDTLATIVSVVDVAFVDLVNDMSSALQVVSIDMLLQEKSSLTKKSHQETTASEYSGNL